MLTDARKLLIFKVLLLPRFFAYDSSPTL